MVRDISLNEKLELWLKEFIHSPVGFDGRKPEELFNSDYSESKTYFNKELPKRKAKEFMKSFLAFDKKELRYWFVEKPNNDKLKILIHGSGSNFCKADRAVFLLDLGFNVAMVSYRGHSGNPGDADQKTIIKDVKAAIEDLIQQGYSKGKIYLEGSSLGTCSLVHALDRLSSKEDVFAGVLLKSSPLHLDTEDRFTLESLKDHHLNYKEAQAFIQKKWNQREIYTRLRAKQILIVHGEDDEVVPVEHAKEIYKLLKKNNEKLNLEIIAGAGHRLDLNQYGLV